MKKQFAILSILILVLLSFTMSAEQTNAETNVGGVISTNTTWTLANSPYIITDTIQIPTEITLTIEPGVVINKPTAGDMFLLNGTIYAHGNIDNKITFDGGSNSNFFNPKSSNSNTFLDLDYNIIRDGISFWPPSGSSQYGHFNLRHSLVENLSNYSHIWYPGKDIYIEYNEFRNSGGFSVGHSGTSKVYIRYNLFNKKNLNLPDYANYYIENWASYDSSKTIIEYNSFIDTDGLVLKLPSGYDNASLTATNNYWGTQDINAIDSMIYDKNDDISVENYINYLPILTEPHPDTPTIVACTSFTYSVWGDCVNGQETRTEVSFSPENCVGGDPILTQSCQIKINNGNDLINQIPEGAVVKTSDNPDVYIVKYKNGKQFKRLVLNPQVFESYGHLKWENILTVSQSEMDSFVVSDLVRVDGQTDVYQLIPNGDVGTKIILDSTAGFDLDSAYTINAVDFGNYLMGEVKGITQTNQESINTESTDEKLQKIISINKECVKTNTERIKGNEGLVVEINNEMDKYSEYLLVQQSGQKFINEIKNDSNLSNEINNICNKLIDESTALLGSEKSSFSTILYLTDQFTSYTKQRNISFDKNSSFMNPYLLNVKSALKQEITKKSEDLERTTIAVRALKQLAVLTTEANNELNILYEQIEEKGKEEEQIKSNPWLSQSSRAGRLKIFYEQYNSLVIPYSTKLEHYKKMLSMQYVIEDFNNNIYISVADRAFLGSLGINF